MKNHNVRHAARRNQLKRCLPLDFPQDISSNHHQRAPDLPAQAAVHLIVQAVHEHIAGIKIH
jgi:hypothetical protein